MKIGHIDQEKRNHICGLGRTAFNSEENTFFLKEGDCGGVSCEATLYGQWAQTIGSNQWHSACRIHEIFLTEISIYRKAYISMLLTNIAIQYS